jgi:hypothetical protein
MEPRTTVPSLTSGEGYGLRLYGQYVSTHTQVLAGQPSRVFSPHSAQLRELIRLYLSEDGDAHLLNLGHGHSGVMALCNSEGDRNITDVNRSARGTKVSGASLLDHRWIT